MKRYVEFWSAGAFRGNVPDHGVRILHEPGKGGWGVLLRHGCREIEIYGGELETTIVRMELTAVIMGLKQIRRPCRIRINTSEYVLEGFRRFSKVVEKKKEVFDCYDVGHGYELKNNQEIWQEIGRLVKGHDIEWRCSVNPESSIIGTIQSRSRCSDENRCVDYSEEHEKADLLAHRGINESSKRRKVTLDIETTGPNPNEGHRVILISCAEIKNRKITRKQRVYRINSGHEMDHEIDIGEYNKNKHIYGYFFSTYKKFYHEDKQPSFAEVKAEIIEFISEAEVIVYNREFVESFLDKELSFTPDPPSRLRDFCKIFSISSARHKEFFLTNSLFCRLRIFCEIFGKLRAENRKILVPELLVYRLKTAWKIASALKKIITKEKYPRFFDRQLARQLDLERDFLDMETYLELQKPLHPNPVVRVGSTEDFGNFRVRVVSTEDFRDTAATLLAKVYLAMTE